jgi:hypothetical protein
MDYEFKGDEKMSCSINIIRRSNTVHEVRYVPDETIDYYYEDESPLDKAVRLAVMMVLSEEDE